MPPIKRPVRQRRRTYFREWREFATDLSQSEVARRIERDHSSLQRLEAGISPYNQDWLELLAALYHCDPQDLISRDPRSSRGVQSDIVRGYQSAPAELQQQITATVRALLKTQPLRK